MKEALLILAYVYALVVSIFCDLESEDVHKKILSWLAWIGALILSVYCAYWL